MIKRRTTALILSLALMLTMMPFTSFDAFAASDSGADDEILQEMARQMQDEDADPFAFRGKGGKMKAQASYPDQYDLRDINDECYVTPVRFQNPFGTCWGFAAIAAAETSILGNSSIRGDLDANTMDLSEKHLVWFTYQPIKNKSNPQYGEGGHYGGSDNTDALNAGGLPFMATSLFASGVGPVLEDQGEELKYHGKDRLVMLRNKTVKKESEITSDEEKAQMYCYSATDDWSLPDDYRFWQSYRLKESYNLPSLTTKTGEKRTAAINAIKEQLSKKRAVEIGFCADTSRPVSGGTEQPTKYISPNWAHYTYESKSANHAVTIVGWDDNYPKENFRHKIKGMDEGKAQTLTTPEGDGAWLVKNSWGDAAQDFPNKGPGWGMYEGQDKAPYYAKKNSKQTGYFWLSYYDKTISMVEALDFDICNVDEGYYMYQYDYMPVNDVKSAFLTDKTSMANVFTSELPSKIEQVTCQTTTPGTEVHYEVYFLNDGASSPVDGTKVAEMDAEYEYGGFHKEDLPEPVTAGTGQRFSVVVTQKTPDDLYSINLQTAYNKTFIDEYNKDKPEADRRYDYSKGIVNEGESYFLAGSGWRDLSEKWIQDLLKGEDSRYYDIDNFAIKVYATEGEEPVKPSDRTKQMGEDGTPFGRGASAEAAEAAALAWTANSDPAGTVFAPLLLKSKTQGKKSVTLSWKQQDGASSYIIYGARSGKGSALKKVAAVNSNGYTVSSIGGAALKKGRYYKFIIVALDSGNNVISSSKMIHAATKGGKVRNYKKVKVTRPAKAKLSLKAGRTYKIKARAVGSKVKKKRTLRYESANPAVATVTSKGRIKAVSAGSCSIRVYAQNGVYKTIKLKVK